MITKEAGKYVFNQNDYDGDNFLVNRLLKELKEKGTDKVAVIESLKVYLNDPNTVLTPSSYKHIISIMHYITTELRSTSPLNSNTRALEMKGKFEEMLKANDLKDVQQLLDKLSMESVIDKSILIDMAFLACTTLTSLSHIKHIDNLSLGYTMEILLGNAAIRVANLYNSMNSHTMNDVNKWLMYGALSDKLLNFNTPNLIIPNPDIKVEIELPDKHDEVLRSLKFSQGYLMPNEEADLFIHGLLQTIIDPGYTLTELEYEEIEARRIAKLLEEYSDSESRLFESEWKAFAIKLANANTNFKDVEQVYYEKYPTNNS